MRRRPRSLFKARRRGGAVYVGPEFVGPRGPNYLPLVDELARREKDRLKPGTVNQVLIYHDDDCSVWQGSACDCEPEVKLAPAG